MVLEDLEAVLEGATVDVGETDEGRRGMQGEGATDIEVVDVLSNEALQLQGGGAQAGHQRSFLSNSA